MSLTHEPAGPKILEKIKIYIISRAKLLMSVWDEIPCISSKLQFDEIFGSKKYSKFKLTGHGFDPDNFDPVGRQTDCHALYDDPVDPLGDDLLGDNHHLCDLDNDLYFDHYFDHYLPMKEKEISDFQFIDFKMWINSLTLIQNYFLLNKIIEPS